MRPLLFAVLASALATLPAAALEVRLAPGPVVLQGDPVSVQVSGAAPGATVEITAERQSARGGVLRSAARYAADAQGRVDTASTPAIGGDYTGVDEAGLFWSMRRIAEATDAPPKGEVRFTARVEGEAPAAAALTLRRSDPRVREEAAEGLTGAIVFRVPDQVRRRPAIILLGGSEGGLSFARNTGPALASRGYVVLGLPYYAPDYGQGPEVAGLPRSFVDIPVERIEEARAYLARRGDVDEHRIGVYGVSKGGEFALLAASRYDWIAATAAIVPSDVVWEGWGPESPGVGRSSSFSWKGKALPFTPYEGSDAYFGAFARGERPTITLADVHAAGRRAHPERAAAARIAVEKIKSPLLVAGGERDTVWPSGMMTQRVLERRHEAGLGTRGFVYAEAGHGLSGPGFEPTVESALGGTPAANGRAQVEIWRATLDLFAEALRPPPVDQAGANP